MRVALLYLAALAPGGYPRDVRWLAGALARGGDDVLLLTQPGPERDGADEVTTVAEETRWIDAAASADVIHVFGISERSQLQVTRRLPRNKPLVVSPLAHLMDEHVAVKAWKKRPAYAAVGRWLQARGAGGHFYSAIERRESARYFSPKRSFLSGAGLFPAASDAAPGEGDYLLFYGRNDVHQKGIDRLLAGYARAVDGGLDLPLIVAGRPHGDSEMRLRTAQADPQLLGRIEVLGETDDERKTALMRGARAFVFLSRWDGPPRPIREALALGTPAIVSRGTNMGALIESYGAGAEVDGSPGSVATSLLRTADDEVVRGWRAGASRLAAEVTWDVIAAEHHAGYELISAR